MHPNMVVANASSANGTTNIVTMACGFSSFYHCSVFIICSVIFAAGFIGNCVAIFLLSTKDKYKKDSTFMSINFLAITDFLAITATYFFDMFTTEDAWAEIGFTKVQCTFLIAIGFAPFLLSCYSVAMLGLVRYHVVAYPLTLSRWKSRKFVVILYMIAAVVLLTIMAVVGHVSQATMTCYEAINYNGNFAFTHPPIILGTFMLLFVLHALKVRRLRMSLSARTYNLKASIRRINIIIYVIMCIFIICQTPFIIADVLQVMIDQGVTVSENFIYILYNVGTVFYILNHAINPYVYFISFYCSQRKKPLSRSSSTRRSLTRSQSVRGSTLAIDYMPNSNL